MTCAKIVVKKQGLPTAANSWELVAQTLQAELAQLQSYADALNARCVADTPDAERYRWLRDGNNDTDGLCPFVAGDDLDAAIDVAMAGGTRLLGDA